MTSKHFIENSTDYHGIGKFESGSAIFNEISSLLQSALSDTLSQTSSENYLPGGQTAAIAVPGMNKCGISNYH